MEGHDVAKVLGGVIEFLKAENEMWIVRVDTIEKAYENLKNKYEHLQSAFTLAAWIYQEPEHTDGIHIDTIKRYSFACEGCNRWTSTWMTEKEAVDEANRLGIAWIGGKVLCKTCSGGE